MIEKISPYDLWGTKDLRNKLVIQILADRRDPHTFIIRLVDIPDGVPRFEKQHTADSIYEVIREGTRLATDLNGVLSAHTHAVAAKWALANGFTFMQEEDET